MIVINRKRSFYTNIPVAEAIDIACHVLYNSDSALEIDRAASKQLMQLAVTDVNFMCGYKWYVQKDGAAMGAAMAVILANVWIKRFEDDISSDEPHSINTEQERSATHDKTMCPVCAKKVTWKGYSIRCKKCNFWFHRNCSEISFNAIKNMYSDQWTCSQCQEEETVPAIREKAKILNLRTLCRR